MKKGMKLYFVIVALTALALALTNDIINNYFKDAYDVSVIQRSLLEGPRELPGMLLIFVIASLSFLSDIRISMIAQLLSFIGVMVLGLVTPTFGFMMVFVFVNSLGMHMYFPMQDSIGMSLAEPDKIGKRMGQYKGLGTAFQMIGAALVYLGFKTGFFSFERDVKWSFLIAGLLFIIIFIIFVYLNKAMHVEGSHPKKARFVFRKEYKYYYVLVIMYGVQKQMMMVYGPWVLIDLLGKKTETMALLSVIGLFIGIFFIPAIGRWLDRFGVKKLLYADAISFILVYFLYGLLSAGYVTGAIAITGLPVIFAYILFIIDRMSTQMSIVRTIYLKTIAIVPEDITPTLSLGISMDHVMSISFAMLGGLIWYNYGPQYIFFLVAALSFVNLYVAVKLKV